MFLFIFRTKVRIQLFPLSMLFSGTQNFSSVKIKKMFYFYQISLILLFNVETYRREQIKKSPFYEVFISCKSLQNVVRKTPILLHPSH